MSVELAEWIVYGLTAVGGVVWLFGLYSLVAAAREAQADPAESASSMTLEESPSARALLGEAEVEGRPDALSVKAASALARDGSNLFGPIKIVRRSDDRVEFEGLGVSVPLNGRGTSGLRVERGRIDLRPVSSARTSLTYLIEMPDDEWLLRVGFGFQLLGLIALGVGSWALLTYAAPSPNMAIRGQVIQMLQAVHFLWEPFLLAYIYRKRRRTVRARCDAFLANLPYDTQ